MPRHYPRHWSTLRSNGQVDRWRSPPPLFGCGALIVFWLKPEKRVYQSSSDATPLTALNEHLPKSPLTARLALKRKRCAWPAETTLNHLLDVCTSTRNRDIICLYLSRETSIERCAPSANPGREPSAAQWSDDHYPLTLPVTQRPNHSGNSSGAVSATRFLVSL